LRGCDEFLGLFRLLFGVLGWERTHRRGFFWGGRTVRFDLFGSAQSLELRPSGVGTTRRHLGATPTPRFCETNRIFMSGKTADKLLRGNLMRNGSEEEPIRFVWNGKAPVLNRADATERVPPGRKHGHGRLSPALPKVWKLGYKAGE
jgi:hypothetical protein